LWQELEFTENFCSKNGEKAKGHAENETFKLQQEEIKLRGRTW